MRRGSWPAACQASHWSGKAEWSFTVWIAAAACCRRAGLAALPTTPTTKDAFVDVLLQERALELCAEGHRWYDLLRTGRQKQRQQTVYNRTVTDQYLRLPIPQSEILLNANLTQNPGYN